ncbi:16S rRNA (uracil(1498)-N(3))-methyltransferase (EC [Olavius algarvensis Delta 1 endosymbiont]|nr:16S rRNA (uracil(1498)-N(3))-methyltransferase (EC [Olavius algarvensis Delta 1 endosymbiont]
MRHFYINPLAVTKRSAFIEGDEAHHIKNVLRLKRGDPLKLFDGTGVEYTAEVKTIEADKVEVAIRNKLRPETGPKVRTMVAQAFLKDKKMDDLVRSLSELGIDGWIPFFSQRSIARPDKKRLAGRVQRWKRIATAALKQCRRKTMLEISDTQSFEEVLELGQAFDLKIVFWEHETKPLNRNTWTATGPALRSVMVMLGPEGGFTDQEIETARQAGFVTAGLGPRILRAETATLAASTLVQYIFGDTGPITYESKSIS